MPAPTPVQLEDLAILIAALEAAHGLSERADGLVDADRPLALAHALGGVDALLALALRHRDRAWSALQTQPQAEER